MKADNNGAPPMPGAQQRWLDTLTGRSRWKAAEEIHASGVVEVRALLADRDEAVDLLRALAKPRFRRRFDDNLECHYCSMTAGPTVPTNLIPHDADCPTTLAATYLGFDKHEQRSAEQAATLAGADGVACGYAEMSLERNGADDNAWNAAHWLLNVAAMVLRKNRGYGDSALNPVRIFSRASTIEQLFVRIDDKLSRIARGAGLLAIDEDVIHDLAGYLALLATKIAKDRSDAMP